MSLTTEDVKKIAHLARLNVTDAESIHYAEQLSHILDLTSQMDAVDTDHIAPLANPLTLPQRLRPDEVTEINQRHAFQAIAPLVEAGLYLVPPVLEGE